jgi:hypothetical protein
MAATFNPALVISDANMRASGSMSAAGIQSFLNSQTGPLKSYVTVDYAGRKRTAAQIISEACTQWHISPRVMLTMLQKEQSLLTRKTLITGDHGTLDWAVGMGCPDSSPRIEKYRGFGNQIWYAAQRLDGYGEHKNGSTIPLWVPPYVVVAGVKTANLATYKLYIYNPSIGAKTPYGDLSTQTGSLSGNANFWHLYSKYFGNPMAVPPGYHTRATIRRTTQLWNSTIRTKRSPSARRGGTVSVTGPIVVRRGRKYVPISWSANRGGGWVRYDDIKWI